MLVVGRSIWLKSNLIGLRLSLVCISFPFMGVFLVDFTLTLLTLVPLVCMILGPLVLLPPVYDLIGNPLLLTPEIDAPLTPKFSQNSSNGLSF